MMRSPLVLFLILSLGTGPTIAASSKNVGVRSCSNPNSRLFNLDFWNWHRPHGVSSSVSFEIELHNECEDENNCCQLKKQGQREEFWECVKDQGCRPSCHDRHATDLFFNPNCRRANECCRNTLFSSGFIYCCFRHGCCPSRCGSPVGEDVCRTRSPCEDIGGTCKSSCDDDEEYQPMRRGCGRKRGRLCQCCVPKSTVIELCDATTPDAFRDCCQYDTESDEYKTCAEGYGCYPMCDASGGCLYNGTTLYNVGDTIDSPSGSCEEMKCELAEIDTIPYIVPSIKIYKHFDGCGCCTLGNKTYENGAVLTDFGYCMGIYCEDGMWKNTGAFNSDCNVCQVTEPSPFIATFDQTTIYEDATACKYSMVQEGTSYDPSSYAYLSFADASNSVGSFVDLDTLYFKDEGASELTCSLLNTVDCGVPLSADPTILNDQGTIGINMMLGADPFTFIHLTTGLLMMFNNDSILFFNHPDNYDETRGVCGKYNGDPTDDLVIRNETTLTDSNGFTDYWQTDDSSCLARRMEYIDNRTRSMDTCWYECNTEVCTATQRNYVDQCIDIVDSLLNSELNNDQYIIDKYRDSVMSDCHEISCHCSDSSMCSDILYEYSYKMLYLHMNTKTPDEIAMMLQLQYRRNY